MFAILFLPWAIALVCRSLLVPQQQVPYLGYIFDSCLQAFTCIPAKKAKFIAFLQDILLQETVQHVTWPFLKLLAPLSLLSFSLLFGPR